MWTTARSPRGGVRLHYDTIAVSVVTTTVLAQLAVSTVMTMSSQEWENSPFPNPWNRWNILPECLGSTRIQDLVEGEPFNLGMST